MPDINTFKKIVEGVGFLNEGQKAIMELLDIQSKSIFEILLFPQTISFSPSSMGLAALDTVVARFHVQTLDIPFTSLEYEVANEKKYVKNIIHPEECTITFIENEIGIIRNYTNRWLKNIVIPDLKGGYFFRDNQEEPKKDAIIILQMGTGLPSTGWIKLGGLRPKSIGNLTIGHGETEFMKLEVTFAIDNSWWKSIW